MAKIGTAHVEIKPVLNDEALEVITAAIEDAVARGVERGMAAATAGIRASVGAVVAHDYDDFMRQTQARARATTPRAEPRSKADDEVIATAIRNRTEHYKSRQ